MEGSKKNGRSSPSLPAQLFDTKNTPSTRTFDSVFPPPSKVVKKSESSEKIETWVNQDSENGTLNTKQEVTDIGSEGVHNDMPNKDRSSIFHLLQGGRVKPCPLCSSLYYNGEENYSMSSSGYTPGSYQILNKDGEIGNTTSNQEIDFGGDLWRGSLYY